MSYPTREIEFPASKGTVTLTFYGAAYETRQYGATGDVIARQQMVIVRGEPTINGVPYAFETTVRRNGLSWDVPRSSFWLRRRDDGQREATHKAAQECWSWLRNNLAAWLASEDAAPLICSGEMRRLEEAASEAGLAVLDAREALEKARERARLARVERDAYRATLTLQP